MNKVAEVIKVLMLRLSGFRDGLSFPLESPAKNLIIHHPFVVQYRNLATLTSLQLYTWCSRAIENKGETTMASSVWQRSSSREGFCWLNFQQLFDKPVTGDTAARCLREKLCVMWFWEHSGFSWRFLLWILIAPSLYFSYITLLGKEQKVRGWNLWIQVGSLLPYWGYAQESHLTALNLGLFLVKWGRSQFYPVAVFLRIKQDDAWGNACQITKLLANISYYGGI